MGGIIKFYLIALLLCAIIGFKYGFSDVNNSTYLQNHVFDPVALECSEENNPEVCELVYYYHDNELYRWNIQTNVLDKTDYWGKLQLEKISPSDNKFPINGDTIITFLGGATAGITIKDFFEQKISKSKSKIVATILGAISGYSIGYKIGTNFKPGVMSDEVQSILNDEKQWKNYEKIFLKQIARHTYEMANNIKDESIAEHYKKDVASLKWIKEEEIDPKALDFLEALNKNDLVQEALNKNNLTLTESLPKEPATKNIKEDNHTPFWLNWWTISACVGFTLIFLVILILKQEKVKKDSSTILARTRKRKRKSKLV
jgi:hypothetical protein